MSLRHYDLLHIEQSENADPDVLHVDIVKLAGHNYGLMIPYFSRMREPCVLFITGKFLHDLYGKEKGIMRLIFDFLSGER